MLRIVIILFSLAFALTAAAQNNEESTTTTETTTTSTEAETPADTGKRGGVETIEVTGSYIRRTDVEGPSPILVIDRQAIEKSGFNSVGQILGRSTVSPFGGTGASVNLKGLGSARTLVLINGQRAPGSGSSYASGAVSTNFVPIAAVERIEVLKDGASATYGSDALGGVVNIITRKDLDGLSLVNQYNLTNTNGGDLNRLAVAYGDQSSNSNFMTSLQVSYAQGSRTSDFDYARQLNQSIPIFYKLL
jgi:iron complex outermembrane receptor protein